MYALGIDLGTTFTAASTWRNGHAEVATLGSRGASIPSVVLLREDETFLTADLHVEFFRPARPGPMRAEGRVVHRSKRMVFCAAELTDGDGAHLASARCTQVLRSAR